MVKIMELMSFIFELQLCKAIIERFEKKCSGLQLSKFAVGEICKVLHVLKWLLLIYMDDTAFQTDAQPAQETSVSNLAAYFCVDHYCMLKNSTDTA